MLTQIDLASQLRTVLARMNRALRQTSAGVDLSPSQYEALATVAKSQRLRISDLAHLEGFNPTMCSRIISHLEQKGLVEKIVDEEDGRVGHIRPTKKGTQLFQNIRAERTAVLSAMLDHLGPSELAALNDAMPVLEQLAQQLKDRT